MYQALTCGKDIIDMARECADISPEIPEQMYLLWLNTLLGRIYASDVYSCAVEQADVTTDETGSYFEISSLDGGSRAAVRECDIDSVLSAGEAFVRSDAASVAVFRDRAQFYGDGDRVYLYHPAGVGSKCTVIFREMPPKFTGDNIESLTLPLPEEHMELPLDYLVGRAYEYANEDTQAAKWLGAFNVALDAFIKWHEGRKGSMGGIGK